MGYASEADRFWCKVEICGLDDCWEWQAARGRTGYGRFRQPRGHEYAHRVAYRLTHGEVPEGLDVLHSCDNPPCCNPAHLRAGTASENNRDSVERGRWGDRSMPGNQHARKKPGEPTRPYRRRTGGQ